MVIMLRYQRGYAGSIPANRSTTIRTTKQESRLYAKIQKTLTSNTREL